MNEQNAIVTQNGESTELTAPNDFGQGMAFLNPSEMPDLESAEVGISLQPEYHEFVNVGDSIRGIYNGMGHITKKEESRDVKGEFFYKDIPAIVLQTKSGIVLNAGASLVNQFKNLPSGTPVQITYKGEEKTQSGNKVKTYDVRLLSVGGYKPKSQEKVAQNETAQAPHKSPVDVFWAKVYDMGLTNIDGQAILKENGGDFQKAYGVLIGNQF
jgi:hypothetical protein